jgi:hypothetical protein
MAKELPYFKFYIGDWNNGDITLEPYDIQGLFVNICAYYWSKDCDLSVVNLHKKFRSDKVGIEQLIESGIIKVINNNVLISFLNEQYESKEVQKITNRINGLKGGRPRKEETEEKPNWLIFANRNESESITETKANDNPNITNIKESKVKKSIVAFSPPTIAEVCDYFKEKGFTEHSAIKAFNYYQVADWKDSKGNKVKNWKQKMQGVWFKDENKIQQFKINPYTRGAAN